MKPVLEGVKVLDLSAGIAGPYATQILSLAGADVTKVEPPQGEWGRIIGHQVNGVGIPFLVFNAGKRSLAVDLKRAEGQAIVRAVASQCDVVIQSFRPGVIERFGLSYSDLSRDREDLVYLSISGFGAGGEHSGRPALDTIIQAYSGWLDICRSETGAPALMDYVPIDVLTGLYGAQAIMAAMIGKFRFGEGRHIEMSLVEAVAAFLAPKLVENKLLGNTLDSGAGVPTGIFSASEGAVALAIKDDRDFAVLAETLGRPEWIQDPRFATRAARAKNQQIFETMLCDVLRGQTACELDQLFALRGVVGAKVNTVHELLQDAHFSALDRIVPFAQRGIDGAVRVLTPGLDEGIVSAAPAVGEQSRAVLTEFNFSDEEIASAFSAGIVV